MIEIEIQHRLSNQLSQPFSLSIKTSLKKGECLALYGPSGSGKTTLLNILAGFIKPNKGSILKEDKAWFDSASKTYVSPQKRNIGMVFQDYALFPNMTVEQQLFYASKDSKLLNQVLDAFELEKRKNVKPVFLSGGEKQRLALARALVQQPELLLLDEPFTALDNKIKDKVNCFLSEFIKKNQTTTILVSHEIAEIIRLSETALCLEEGKIIKEGTPTELFHNTGIKERFQFEAKVLEINKGEKNFELILLNKLKTFRLNVSEEQGKKIRVGDQIILASDNFSPTLYKK